MAFNPIWPVVGPVTQSFSINHPAIDIAILEGTLVVAIAPGRVRTVDWDTLVQQPPDAGYAGFFIEIDHAEGWRSRYLHLVPFSNTVSEGQKVECGQVIAQADTTGSATGPHLHLAFWNPNPVCLEAIGVRPDLYACDPLRYLPAEQPGECPTLPTTRVSSIPLLLLGMVGLGMITVLGGKRHG